VVVTFIVDVVVIENTATAVDAATVFLIKIEISKQAWPLF